MQHVSFDVVQFISLLVRKPPKNEPQHNVLKPLGVSKCVSTTLRILHVGIIEGTLGLSQIIHEDAALNSRVGDSSMY